MLVIFLKKSVRVMKQDNSILGGQMRDYRIKTKVSILTGFPSEEFNSLMFESAKQNIINAITDIIKSDEILPKYIEGDLFFRFYGYKVSLEYTFECHDENRKEAESFSRDSIERIRSELGENGYKIEKIHCHTKEVDEKEIEHLEDRFF